MITFLINLTYTFVQFIINLFPVGVPFGSAVHNGFVTIGGYIHTLDALIPFNTLLICLTLLFSVELAIFSFRTLKWVLSHIPMFGGKG